MRFALILPILAVRVFAQPPARGGVSLPPLDACAAQSGCAPILKPFAATELAALSDSVRLVAALMQSSAAIAALGNDHGQQIAGAGYCFKTRARTPSDSSLVSAAAAPMQPRLPRLRWCRSDEAPPNPPLRERVVVVPGARIMGLTLNSVSVSGDSATSRIMVGYSLYDCRVVREAGIWRPVRCTILGTGRGRSISVDVYTITDRVCTSGSAKPRSPSTVNAWRACEAGSAL
jgi:hypothetical protein